MRLVYLVNHISIFETTVTVNGKDCNYKVFPSKVYYMLFVILLFSLLKVGWKVQGYFWHLLIV